MKRNMVAGLVALVLAIGCEKKESFDPPSVLDPGTHDVTYVEKADISYPIERYGKKMEPAVIVNGDTYLFIVSEGDSSTSQDEAYMLTKLAPDQPIPLVGFSFDDPNHDRKWTMDLGDGRIYTLAYNAEIRDYQITPNDVLLINSLESEL